MVVLHVSVSEYACGFSVTVDRLLREDATPRECEAVDQIHDILRASLENSPARVGPIVEIQSRAQADTTSKKESERGLP